MNNNKKIYNINEMAIYLNISISELRKLVRMHKIPFFKIGNRIKFQSESINNWIEKLEKRC